jgi:hypothetical protein
MRLVPIVLFSTVAALTIAAPAHAGYGDPPKAGVLKRAVSATVYRAQRISSGASDLLHHLVLPTLAFTGLANPPTMYLLKPGPNAALIGMGAALGMTSIVYGAGYVSGKLADRLRDTDAFRSYVPRRYRR